MTNQIHWKVQSKDNGTFVANANFANPNQIRRGGTASFTFDIPDADSFNTDKTYSSDTTVPTAEVVTWNDVTIDSGVTVTVDGVLQATSITVNGTLDVTSTGEVITSTADFGLVQLFREWAGSKAQQRMLDGAVKAKSQLPANISLSSIIVGIEPAGDLKDSDIRGVWAILDRVDDGRVPALTNNEYRFEATVLASFDDYGDHPGLEADLQL